MEWDTAASEIILNKSGCSILSWPDRSLLKYNKEDRTNPILLLLIKTWRGNERNYSCGRERQSDGIANG